MKTLNISVVDKKATYSQRGGAIVCNNSDYQIKFTFDDERGSISKKTARFVHGGEFTDVDFTGDTVTVPAMQGVTEVKVGVYAGELYTTTAARIPCLPSIACQAGTPSIENDKTYANEAKAAAERAAEDAREEVARLVGELGVVQAKGTSPTAVMSQKAVTDELYLNNNIPNTVQTVTLDSSGRVASVKHTDNSGSVVRTDKFTYTDTTVTEVRTLSNGSSQTIIFHYDTLKVEVK
jgi:hypothetical protein